MTIEHDDGTTWATITVVREDGDRVFYSCGCWTDLSMVDGVRAFVIEPHGLRCPLYLYVLEQLGEQAKRVEIVDLR